MHRQRPYGLLAEFATPEAMTAALRGVRKAGYVRLDAFSPFPLEEAQALLPGGGGKVAFAALAGGVCGGIGGYGLQYGSVLDYPLNVGGRPLHSWPSFIPIAFEMTVLGAALAGIVAMLIVNGLPRLHHPLFEVTRFSLASDDRFFICIRGDDPNYGSGVTEALLRSLGAAEVTEVADEA